jgi:hypothetical protein
MSNEQGPLCEMSKRLLQHWPNNFIIYCLCHHILDIDFVDLTSFGYNKVGYIAKS